MENNLTTDPSTKQTGIIEFELYLARDEHGNTWQKLAESQEENEKKGPFYRTAWDYLSIAKKAWEVSNPSSKEHPGPTLRVALVFGKKSDFLNTNVLNRLIVRQEQPLSPKNAAQGSESNPFCRKISTHPGSDMPKDTIPMILLSDLPLFGKANDGLQGKYDSTDPRIGFLDSSIWHRAFSFRKGANDTLEDFRKRFQNLCKELWQNHSWGLYHTLSALESLEFQCRLLHNSYLIELEDGHASAVTPFRFHSETKMKAEAEETLEKLEVFRWSVTMVDDFVNTPLKTKDSKKEVKPEKNPISKGALISELLNASCELATILNEQKTIEKKNAETDWMKEGIELMTERSPERQADVFILDYFLGKDPADNSRYLFGTDVIEGALQKQNEHLSGQKLWIFPIAVFDNAFSGHLAFAGNQHNRTNLELANPVDPITMPNRFRYEFYQFLLHNKDARKVQLGETLRNLNKKITTTNIREKLREAYPEILESLYRIQQLKRIRVSLQKEEGLNQTNPSFEKEGFFAVSYLNSFSTNGELEQVCHQVQHLTHLIAFGSRQDLGKAMMEVMRLRDLQQVLVKAKESEISEPLEYWLREISAYLQKL